ncbi:MFS general substrate transporter [Nemania sp. NC0429]|nr:MFS general substrate transporter [Nemania sp. NC0429]
MGLDIYWIGLLVLAPLVAIVAGHETIRKLAARATMSAEKKQQQEKGGEVEVDPLEDEAAKFQRTFLSVYLLAVGSEWLQNPFTYSLFRNEKTLDEATVANLYIGTYVAAAAAALVAGHLTDRLGRRRACLAFCGAHSLAAASVCFDGLPVLVLGRVLGGVALALLWTSFESWAVAEYNARGLARSSLSLGAMLARVTTAKCVAAIAAGVLGHYVVLALGSKIHPFILSVALDVFAAALMMRTWNENWGISRRTATATDAKANADANDIKAAEAVEAQDHVSSSGEEEGKATTTSLWDPRVWAMSFVASSFEGTIFLFMFFWPETLQDAHDREHPGLVGDGIPHGVIFASFMAIMALGALFFNFVAAGSGDRKAAAAEEEEEEETRWRRTLLNLSPTRLLEGALVVSAVCFMVAAFVRGEAALFVSFLALEVCNGIYVPSVAYHRGTIVTDDARARVYSLMNIPLFVFVVIALRMAGGGGGGGGNGADAAHATAGWEAIFLMCAALLLVAAVVTLLYLHAESGKPGGYSEIHGQDLASTRQVLGDTHAHASFQLPRGRN